MNAVARWQGMFRDRDDDWWTAGIQFTCLPDCGRCCDEPEGIVYLSEEDADRLAEHHQLTRAEWLARDARRVPDGSWVLESSRETSTCIYLDEAKRCTVYESKPAQCSAFPFWRENMVSDRSWGKTKRLCPGVDHPDAILVDADTIRLHLVADAHAERGFRESI